jgi:hypothetical protein
VWGKGVLLPGSGSLSPSALPRKSPCSAGVRKPMHRPWQRALQQSLIKTGRKSEEPLSAEVPRAQWQACAEPDANRAEGGRAQPNGTFSVDLLGEQGMGWSGYAMGHSDPTCLESSLSYSVYVHKFEILWDPIFVEI